MSKAEEIWAVLAVLTAGTDLVIVHRRLAGKLGTRAQQRYADTARKFGGIVTYMLFFAALDLVFMPIAVVGLFIAYVKDNRALAQEKRQELYR